MSSLHGVVGTPGLVSGSLLTRQTRKPCGHLDSEFACIIEFTEFGVVLQMSVRRLGKTLEYA